MTFLPANSIASLSVTIAQGHFHKWQGVVMIRYSTIEDRVWHLCGTARAPGGQQPSKPQPTHAPKRVFAKRIASCICCRTPLVRGYQKLGEV